MSYWFLVLLFWSPTTLDYEPIKAVAPSATEWMCEKRLSNATSRLASTHFAPLKGCVRASSQREANEILKRSGS